VDAVRGRHERAGVIRLIALDVDGTLLDSRWQVPEANRRALLAATALGVEVVLVTGRRFEFARPVIDQLAGPLTLIVNNGALVKTRDGETLMRYVLPAAVARQLLEATARFRETTAVVFDRAGAGQVIYERLESPDPHRASYYERNREFIGAVEPLDASLVEDPLQLMFTGSVGTMRELLATLRELPFADQFSIAVTEYEQPDFSLVDVTRRGCSKGSTLAEWAVRRGVGRQEVMAIGDNLNDRDMLEYAGVPVVMGNAVPGLRAAGWHVTRSNDDAGVADAVNRFVLHPPVVTSPASLNP
jgi:Cof subfamily protein (haloacid dehalogenase superfamily)